MTDHPEILITVFVVLTALGVGIGVFSMRRCSKCRRLYSLAVQAAEQGRSGEALCLLLEAERSWAFNAHDGSRSSSLTDLEDFSRILEQLDRLGADSADDAPLAQVQRLVVSLRGLLSDRSNFGIDGRMMKREAAVRWGELSGEFDVLRQTLRREIERMKRDVGAARKGGPATPRGNSELTEGPPSVI